MQFAQSQFHTTKEHSMEEKNWYKVTTGKDDGTVEEMFYLVQIT